MSTKIQIKRGSRAGLPALAPGEYGLTTDSEELFIGGANRNLQIPILGEEGQIPTSQLPKLTAADVGARPDNWIPTAEEVGARPDSWTPTASDVGADPAGSSESALQTAKTYTDQKISEISTPDVSKQIQNHNESADAHSNQFSNVLKTSGGGTVNMDESFGVGPYNIEVSEDADTGDFTAAQVGYNNVATGMAATNVQDAVTELFQSVSNGKSLIAGAITDKGISTSATDTFQQMADNISAIETGSTIKFVNCLVSYRGYNNAKFTYQDETGVAQTVTNPSEFKTAIGSILSIFISPKSPADPGGEGPSFNGSGYISHNSLEGGSLMASSRLAVVSVSDENASFSIA